MTVIKRGRPITGDEYKAAMERLRKLPADVMEDIERYRAYCELGAYEAGVLHAQFRLKVPVDEVFTSTGDWCHLIGEPWEVVDD